jgi:hypothetical protein
MLWIVTAGAVVGAVATVVAFAFVYRDAHRLDISRPLLWAVLTAAPIALGTGLFVFTDAPMPGVLMTATTGIVLYGFEREVTTERGETRTPETRPEK